MSRTRRLTTLSQLLAQRRISSQEELARALAREGVPVTQATLSRDLRSLGVGKRPGPDGLPVYVLPAPAVEIFDRERQRLDLVAFVNEGTVAQNLAVIKTPTGHANSVQRAIHPLSLPRKTGSV